MNAIATGFHMDNSKMQLRASNVNRNHSINPSQKETEVSERTASGSTHSNHEMNPDTGSSSTDGR